MVRDQEWAEARGRQGPWVGRGWGGRVSGVDRIQGWVEVRDG